MSCHGKPLPAEKPSYAPRRNARPLCVSTAAPGWYTLHVQYFDLPAGVARFRVLVANQVVDEWAAADHLPARKIDASASVRRVIPGIALRAGDEIRIEGVPDGGDPAALDYVEILSAPVAADEPVARTDQNSLAAHAQLVGKSREGPHRHLF